MLNIILSLFGIQPKVKNIKIWCIGNKVSNEEYQEIIKDKKCDIMCKKVNQNEIQNMIFSDEVLLQYNKYKQENNCNINDIYTLMHSTLNEIEKIRQIPNIAYYGFSNDMIARAKEQYENAYINSNDIAFISQLLGNDKYHSANEIDLILNTSGGQINVAKYIIDYLRANFKKVNVIVPRFAMSAGTMMACGADEIIVIDISTFSPCNPRVNNIDTYFLKRLGIISHIFSYLIDKDYRIHFTIRPSKLANTLESNVRNTFISFFTYSLQEKNLLKRFIKIRKLLYYLTDFRAFYSHETYILPHRLQELGLNIKFANKELKNLLLQHHFIMRDIFALDNVSKVYANKEVRWYEGY